MNPTLLTILMVTVPSLFLAYLAPSPVNYFFMLTGIIPIILCIWQISKFTVENPYHLRNDRHVEKMAQLRIGSNEPGHQFEITINSTGELVENPKLSDGASK